MPVKKPMTAGNRFKGRFKTLCRWISSKKLRFSMLQKGVKITWKLLRIYSQNGYQLTWLLEVETRLQLSPYRSSWGPVEEEAGEGDFWRRRGWENAEAAKRLAAWQHGSVLWLEACAPFLPPGIFRATKPSQRSGSESYKTATLFPAHSSSTLPRLTAL